MKKCATRVLARVLWLSALISLASSLAGQGDHPPMLAMKLKTPSSLNHPIQIVMP